ncbi:Kyphoscoliosis peptidase [Paragonimus heterotremus]|uniref:Kyphoscoliosis peptidase n=1 Tax=Paragonimus heterotremus TaxID=100268 RepID=A0A8J4SU50_9TREM|nr:Kyphoscoliosis peptidase [Paragonimus heterotremus]
MGQRLSCVSKTKKKNDEDIKKPRGKRLPLKGKKTVLVQEVVTPVAVPAAEAAPPAVVNHVAAEADAQPVRRRPKLVLLKPAPAKAKPPTPLPQQSPNKVTPVLDKSTFAPQSRSNRTTPVGIHVSQPVDQTARELAQNEARPATWNDLYWALIGSRNLPNDEAKVKALFSWLCSIPLDQDAFVTHDELDEGIKEGVEFAEEAKKAKPQSPSADSPEVVVNDLTRGKSTYLRAFESLCRYSNIPCRTVKGLAKGVDYTVGMKLTDQPMPPEPGDNSAIGRIQHAWSAAYIDGKWALFDSMWAAERLAMSANARLSQIAQFGRMEYETDMFYFNADPAIFIHSHFPFEPEWQLLDPPLSLQQFQSGVLLKPAFFTHGLGLFSHQDGVIPVQNKLIIKLSIPPSLVKVLLFTFNLKLDGKSDMFEGVNLSRFGMHEISARDALIIFSFRFPKAGAYKLTMYARKVGEPLFTDICEYRVEAKGTDGDSISDATSNPGSISIPPFPPTSQSHYGPTEKAAELQIQTVPSDLEAARKCTGGVFEVRFATVDQAVKLPRMTARLKSLLHDASMLTDCILVRTVDAATCGTVGSVKSGLSQSTTGGPMVPMCVITAYLPSAGEYALEVYGAPPDADEDTSYFLVWQFMIDTDYGVRLDTPVRKRLSTINLGPQDSSWSELKLKTVSHVDPLIHVPTKGLAGLRKARSKNELLQQFNKQAQRLDKERQGIPMEDTPSALVVSSGDVEDKVELVEEPVGPRSCDLKIILEKPKTNQLCIVGQLVDISEPKEEDCTTYLLQQVDDIDEAESAARSVERIAYLIRIPKGDHFYKFYLYAAVMEANPAISLPLVYTYLLEAPQRLMASEVPYIGVQHGPFPEKLEQQQQQNKQVVA